jgi:Mn-containing catalase
MDGIATARDTAMIGAAQRVEHYEIAGYHSAISLAQAQGHTEAVSLLEANLREEEHADRLLSEIAERTMKNGDGSTMGAELPVAIPRSARNGARKANGHTRKRKAGRGNARTH